MDKKKLNCEASSLIKWMDEKAKPFKISDLETIEQRFGVSFKKQETFNCKASSLKQVKDE